MSINDDLGEEKLSDPAVPLSDWPERPTGVTGEVAKELGRMLLDDAVPASEILAGSGRWANRD